MSKKLSEAQRKVLERLMAGDKIEYRYYSFLYPAEAYLLDGYNSVNLHTVYSLEGRGLIKPVEADKRRCYYTITDAGRAALEQRPGGEA